jgi:diguanylate cyclase (GGDEF)-like protein
MSGACGFGWAKAAQRIGFMGIRRTVAVIAGLLLLGQSLAIGGWRGGEAAALASDLVQAGLGMLCLIACVHVCSVVGKASRYHWTWLAVSFVGFVLAQSLGTYIDLSSNHAWDWMCDVLFSLSAIPTAMLPFLDPDREPSRFDRLHVLDFLQVFCFWASVYLYFANTPSLSLATTGWEGFGWSSSTVLHAVLTVSFVLRVLFSRSTQARSFFGAMAAYVLLAGLADAYASLPANNVQSGHWFDLIWSGLLGIPLLVALTWNQDVSLAPHPDQAGVMISNQLFPLVYPFFSVLFLVQDARRMPTVSSAIAIVVFAALAVRILIIQKRLLQAQLTLQFEASHDALTGACNRGAILEILKKEIGRQQRSPEPLAVMLADLDHFKAVNDTYGHGVGDQVLMEVVRRLTGSVRAGDSVGRYGGEEFLLVLPNCDAAGAATVGERARAAIAELPVPTAAGAIRLTISVGVSTSPAGGLLGKSLLLRLADEALYQAKAEGRNRVQMAKVCLRETAEPLCGLSPVGVSAE